MFDPSDAAPGRFADYRDAPVPDPRDDEMDEFVTRLRGSGEPVISEAVASASANGCLTLVTYARRTVDRAVQDNDLNLLVSGCAAVAMSMEKDGLYNAMIFMARMVVAAERMGSTRQAVIGAATTDLPDGPGRQFLLKWLEPDPADGVDTVTPFDPSDPAPALRRFRAWGPAPFPDPRDAELDQYIANVRRAGTTYISRASADASQRGCDVLLAYAGRTAVRAVRARDSGLLVSGYVAMAMAVVNHDDIREAIVFMAPMHDAAKRSGSKPKAVINEAAGLVEGFGRRFLMQWSARPWWLKSLKAMGYETVEDADGFRYRPTW